MEEMSIIDQLAMLRITASSEIPPHEFLFAWNGIPCFARGELVAVTGKAKSGKTYLNSLLMAACAGEGRLGLSRIGEKPMRVVWIDTEQSEDTTCEILRDRISAMTSRMPDENLYHVFNLRKIQWKDRMTLVLSAIAICQPDVVIFDGIRDVVGDINDYTEAQNTIGQLLRVASEFHTCIVCVLHQNKAVEDKTLRGALGTELQNKSFETYECSKDQETRIFTIKQTATRKYDMPNKIQFCLDKAGLPVLCQNVEENISSAASRESVKFTPSFVGTDGKIDKTKLFDFVLRDKSLPWNELRTKMMQTANIHSVHFAETLMQEARDSGLLQTLLINNRREYMLRSQRRLFDEDT